MRYLPQLFRHDAERLIVAAGPAGLLTQRDAMLTPLIAFPASAPYQQPPVDVPVENLADAGGRPSARPALTAWGGRQRALRVELVSDLLEPAPLSDEFEDAADYRRL